VRAFLTITALLVLVPAAGVRAQTPAEIGQHIDRLAAFDYPTRMTAARMLRRVPPAAAVPALDNAVRRHPDEFVRYRALVLLTSFNDRDLPERMRSLAADRNDRVREVVYRWFERHPDAGLTPLLRAALETEQAEFVRPALVRALAALPPDPAVQRALIGEVGRGFDFFRSAVIDALGEYRATYAIDAIAAVAQNDGPLQDDAVLALGRIGDRRAVGPLAKLSNAGLPVQAALQASQCMLGAECAARVEWLVTAARNARSTPELVHAAVAALGEIARRDASVRAALLDLAGGPERLRNEASLALSSVALRDPDDMLEWIERQPEAQRQLAITLLHEGFEALEEDFAEEQFFATARAAYWSAGEGSQARTLMASIIEILEF
jgi:HEAT repeat protein